MDNKKAPQQANFAKRKFRKRLGADAVKTEKENSNKRAGGDENLKEDLKKKIVHKIKNAKKDLGVKNNQKVEDHDIEDEYSLYNDEEDSQFKRIPTLRVTRKKGNFRVMFQPIRQSEHEQPLLPLEILIPDEWSDDETSPRHHSSDDSDLDIEYLAPAAFMKQEPKKKPLVLVMKQNYDYAEVEKYITDQAAAAAAEAAAREDERNKKREMSQPSLARNAYRK